MNPIGQVNPQGQVGYDAILVKPKRQIGPFVAHVTLREVHTDALEITDQPVEQGASITDHAFKKPAVLLIEAMWSNSPQKSFEPPPVPPKQTLENIISDGLEGVAGPADAVVDEVRQLVTTVTQEPQSPPVQAVLTGNDILQVREVYQALLQLQESRIPFDVVTGKRLYTNMLVQTLVETTDKETENALHIQATLRQVLIASVTTRTISAPRANQQEPGSTMPLEDKGNKQLGSAPNFNMTASQRAGIDARNAQITAETRRLVASSVQDLADDVARIVP